MREPSTSEPCPIASRSAVLAICLAAAFWLAGAVGAPMAARIDSTAGWLLRALYAPVCHQAADRCVSLAAGPLAVCARCTGLYTGCILGLLAGATAMAWTRRIPRWVFFAALAPTALDAMLAFAGLPSLANLPRLLLAVPAGAVCGWFLAAGVGEIAGAWSGSRNRELVPGRGTGKT